MRNTLFVLMTLLFALCLLPKQTLYAQDKPVQIALFNPVQIFPEQQSITGIRLNILYGKNATVKGLDLGLVNHTTAGTSVGIQYGLVGYNEANFTGLMDNSVNITKGTCKGVQVGFVNYTGSMNGLQLGFVNYAASMKGLQIGLVNIISQGGVLPVLPIVNWSF